MLKEYTPGALAAGLLTTLLLSPAGAQEANKLSATEASAAYDLLFNGTDLANWHAYRQTAVTDAWKVRTDGTLGARIQNGPGTKRPILSNKKYMNFDLKIDVMVTEDGNSGIFVRYEEVALDYGDTRSGPELQICGPANRDCNGELIHFGSCYEMFAVASQHRNTWYNPPGQWNQIRIIAFDSNYAHYGNGKKLLEYKIGTKEFLDAYNDSKYKGDGNNGRYYHIHPGGVLLQHHGEEGMAFRNIKAKELTVHPFKSHFQDGKWPETLPQDFVFGATTPVRGAAPHASRLEIAAGPGGTGERLVTVPFGHTGFQASGVDGKALPHRKIGDGLYSIGRGQRSPGIAIIRLSAEGERVTRIISLQ